MRYSHHRHWNLLLCMPYRIVLFKDNSKLRQWLLFLQKNAAGFVLVGDVGNCPNAMVMTDEFQPDRAWNDTAMCLIALLKPIGEVLSIKAAVLMVISPGGFFSNGLPGSHYVRGIAMRVRVSAI